MVSKEVIRVKHAPDMNLSEAVRHFAFLLSEQNVKFVQGKKSQQHANLKRDIEEFSGGLIENPNDGNNMRKGNDGGDDCDAGDDYDAGDADENDTTVSASSVTANAALAMFRKSKSFKTKSKTSASDVGIIDQYERNRVLHAAERCLAWAHDPARTAVPGAENVTDDQVFSRAID